MTCARPVLHRAVQALARAATAVLVCSAAAGCAAGDQRAAGTPASSSVGPSSAISATGVPAVPAAGSPAARVLPPLRLPAAGSTVVFLGDSYTVGLGATPETGFAPRTAADLGWRADVEGVNGSGFVARSAEGLDYPRRVQALSADRPALVVVEGGLNDVFTGAAVDAVADGERRTLTELAARWPGVPVVVVGPPRVPKAEPVALDAVDRVLTDVSADLGVRYLSPLREGWPVEQYAHADGIHPDAAGHALFAQRLAEDLRAAAH